ncbi:unnamed protein product [Linum tenue]|uniref:Transmembrane protein n=2 Tax=Linum tenue TaxID=586396 RepID=A0AAV0NQA9_9ROSI|nr:unnamed protein product [Linum tenue]
MEISEKLLLQYKYHFAAAAVASLFLSLLMYAAPSLLTILAYFLPLLASTTVFLILIMAFGGVSRLNIGSNHQQHGQGNGEGLLDYVAGRPDENHYAL